MSDNTDNTDTDDRSIDDVVDDLFDARERIFKHVGYVEQWRDLPFDDSRDNYWAIGGTFSGQVKFSPDREALVYWLGEHDDEYGPHGDKLFDHEIYAGRHDAKEGIHRGAALTMICVDTNTDGNMFFQLFRNDHEIKPVEEPEVEEPEVAAPTNGHNGHGEPKMLGVIQTPTSLLSPNPPVPDIVFVRTETGSDETGDGTSVEKAYKSIEHAVKDVTTRFGAEANCLIDFDGAGEVGKRFWVRR